MSQFSKFLKLHLATWAIGLCGLVFLSACNSNPLVVVATPVPLDAGFQIYRHRSGVFTLRLPPNWAVHDISTDNTIRVEFSPPGNQGLPLSVYVINTGNLLSTNDLLNQLDNYQKVINGDPKIYTEISRNAQGDGSWRITGLRRTAIGIRQINTFLQANQSYFSALEVDLTDLQDGQIQTLRNILNTYRVDPTAIIKTGNLNAAVANNLAVANLASGVLVFDNVYAWTNPQGVFIIDGQITNSSGGALEAIRVTATLYDKENRVLAQQQDVIPMEVLGDGASSPFAIRFRGGKPSQAVRYEVEAAARNAEYALQTYLDKDKFLIANDKATFNANGYLTVSGDVVNKTQAAAHFIKAIVTVFDIQQHVIGVDSVFLAKPDLLPGEPSHFDITFFELGGSAAKYVVTVEGKTQ